MSESTAIPMATMEFAALCLDNALLLLQEQSAAATTTTMGDASSEQRFVSQHCRVTHTSCIQQVMNVISHASASAELWVVRSVKFVSVCPRLKRKSDLSYRHSG